MKNHPGFTHKTVMMLKFLHDPILALGFLHSVTADKEGAMPSGKRTAAYERKC